MSEPASHTSGARREQASTPPAGGNPNGAPEPDFDALYRDVILDHYREPHGRADIARVDARAEGMNPLCGDEVDVALALDAKGRVERLQVEGRGCAISVASGSILHDLVVGASVPEARRILGAVKSVLHGAPLPADPDLGDFDALEGVQKFPVRIKCALLPWTTLDEALGDWERNELAAARQASSSKDELAAARRASSSEDERAAAVRRASSSKNDTQVNT